MKNRKKLHTILLLLLVISSIHINSYAFINKEIINVKYQDELTINKLLNAMNKTGFKLKNTAKRVPLEAYPKMFRELIEPNTELMKQLEISSWAICDYQKKDNYNIYIQNYKYITRDVFNKYCKELNALMIIDGTIIQPK